MGEAHEAEERVTDSGPMGFRRGAQSDYIRDAIKEDLRNGRFDRVHTRFPPEPNAYLHIGHAKALWIDYGIALDAGGRILAGGKGRLPFQTGHPRIFAGGDNMRGADLVVRAVHDGREAAGSIAQMLSALPVTEIERVA